MLHLRHTGNCGLRDYGTAAWTGGNENCTHEASERYYTERSAAKESLEAFSKAGEANAERVKQARWRESGHCVKCGAVKTDRQLGLEKTPEEYVAKLVTGFREVRRVLKQSGTLWLNLGDSYCGSGDGGGGNRKNEKSWFHNRPTQNLAAISNIKSKDLVGIPWRVAFALQADGWYLRSDIIWHKPNPMPESVTDRPTKAHEYIFLMSKSQKYFYDAEAIKEPCETEPHAPGNKIHPDKISGPNDRNGNSQWETSMDKVWGESGTRNKRSVWTVVTSPYREAHFATFPPELITPCILAGTRPGDTVLDPFAGSGTTGEVALGLGRKVILIDINPKYIPLIRQRTHVTPGLQLA